MTVGRLSIVLRQPAPGDETHDVCIIVKQDRGSITLQRLEDRIQRCIEHGGKRLCMVQLIG